MEKIFSWLDSHEKEQIALLRQAVKYPSVSVWIPTHAVHIEENAKFFSQRLEALGFKTEFRPVGTLMIDGKSYPIPPVILGKFEKEDPKKKTLLVYGHLDVQPAMKSDGWDSEPFTLDTRDGKMYGRGSTDDKGPVLAWTNALQAYKETGVEFPVNIRFVLESMEESGSEGLEDLLCSMKENNDPFLTGIDYCCISDSYWLGNKKPCLAYGLRGSLRFHIKVKCASADLHSGVCGGLVNEAMTDLVWMMNRLVSVDGKLLVPGIFDQVKPLTEKEAKTYESIDFDMKQRKADIGTKTFLHEENPARVMQSVWRYPWLSLHGIEGAFAEKGFKTVIPGTVTGKFSIRTVPDMVAEDTRDKVLAYLNDLWSTRGSSNEAEFLCTDMGEWYYVDPNSDNYAAARKAIKTVWNEDPDLIREGGSIPITLVIQQCTGKDVCLLPLGCSNDGAHSQNEKFDIKNYINGSKVMAAYLHELASL